MELHLKQENWEQNRVIWLALVSLEDPWCWRCKKTTHYKILFKNSVYPCTLNCHCKLGISPTPHKTANLGYHTIKSPSKKVHMVKSNHYKVQTSFHKQSFSTYEFQCDFASSILPVILQILYINFTNLCGTNNRKAIKTFIYYDVGETLTTFIAMLVCK